MMTAQQTTQRCCASTGPGLCMNSLTKTLEVAMSLMQQNDKINMIKNVKWGDCDTEQNSFKYSFPTGNGI